MVYVFSLCTCLSVYMCVHVRVNLNTLAEHNTHCMYKPRLRAALQLIDFFGSETAPARTPQSIANGEFLQIYSSGLSFKQDGLALVSSRMSSHYYDP